MAGGDRHEVRWLLPAGWARFAALASIPLAVVLRVGVALAFTLDGAFAGLWRHSHVTAPGVTDGTVTHSLARAAINDGSATGAITFYVGHAHPPPSPVPSPLFTGY